MHRNRLNLRKVIVIAIYLAGVAVFSNCNQSAKEKEVDSNKNSHSVEDYSEQISRVQELTGGNTVYWTKSDTKYHLYNDCTHIPKDEIFSGTVEQALELKNITGLCEVCEHRRKPIMDANVVGQLIVKHPTYKYVNYSGAKTEKNETIEVSFVLLTAENERKIQNFSFAVEKDLGAGEGALGRKRSFSIQTSKDLEVSSNGIYKDEQINVTIKSNNAICSIIYEEQKYTCIAYKK